ncbi:MAG: hypothetical protein HY043_08085 [Verrucomicrobia bacterium]|nr:hypothetical protein [Verrucomicrobiota bacterium]
MKTKNYLSLLAIIATALSLNITTATAQSVDSVESLKNHAIVVSPRAKETFPWLTRSALPRTEACCPVNELTAVKSNRALVASPRVLEQFPELTRSASTRPAFSIAPLVEKNAAVLSSPRAREEFPARSRGTPPATAKGGATKLMELGK